MTAFKSRVTHL